MTFFNVFKLIHDNIVRQSGGEPENTPDQIESNEVIDIVDPTSLLDGIVPFVNADGWWWADHYVVNTISNNDSLVKRIKPIIIHHLQFFYKEELQGLSVRERVSQDRIFRREFLKGNEIFINENFFPANKYGKNTFSDLPGVINTTQDGNGITAIMRVGNEMLTLTWGYKRSPIRFNVIKER